MRLAKVKQQRGQWTIEPQCFNRRSREFRCFVEYRLNPLGGSVVRSIIARGKTPRQCRRDAYSYLKFYGEYERFWCEAWHIAIDEANTWLIRRERSDDTRH